MFLNLLQKRRSIRDFETRQIEKEKMDSLMEAMLRSPSSRSLNPWEFVVVDDPQTLAALAKAKPHGASLIARAPLAIVVCGDPQKCDVWVEDCSIASLLIHLAATDLGLGSCWVQLRLRQHESGVDSSEYVADLLELPERLKVEAVVAVGYPAEEKPGHDRESLLWDRVHWNRYGNRSK